MVRDDHGVTVTLASGAVLGASLLVAAEGRSSPTRQQAGIAVARWSYPHTALVTAIDHDEPHGNTAYEIFYTDGPFALLPMQPGTRSAIVWTVPTGQAPAYLKLPTAAWLTEAQKRMGGFLGKISLAAPMQSYPLGYHRAARITDQRLALVGDAAHGIHPDCGAGRESGLSRRRRARRSDRRGHAHGNGARRRAAAGALSALARARFDQRHDDDGRPSSACSTCPASPPRWCGASASPPCSASAP